MCKKKKSLGVTEPTLSCGLYTGCPSTSESMTKSSASRRAKACTKLRHSVNYAGTCFPMQSTSTESACPDLVRTQITLTCKQLGPESFRHAAPSSGPGCQMRFTRQKTVSFRRQLNSNLVLAPLSVPPPSLPYSFSRTSFTAPYPHLDPSSLPTGKSWWMSTWKYAVLCK